MACLKGLPKLKDLTLYNTNITDAGVEELTAVQSLQSLNLQRSTNLTDAATGALKKLPHLTSLFILYNNLSDQGVASLKDMTQLRLARHARPVVDDRRRHVFPEGSDQSEDPEGPPPCQRRRLAERRRHDQARHPLAGRLRVYRRWAAIALRPARPGGP